MKYKITPLKFTVAVIGKRSTPLKYMYEKGLNGICHVSRHFHEAQTSYFLSVNSVVSLGFSMAAFRKNSFRLFLELRHMAIFIVIGDGLSFISIYM